MREWTVKRGKNERTQGRQRVGKDIRESNKNEEIERKECKKVREWSEKSGQRKRESTEKIEKIESAKK